MASPPVLLRATGFEWGIEGALNNDVYSYPVRQGENDQPKTLYDKMFEQATIMQFNQLIGWHSFGV